MTLCFTSFVLKAEDFFEDENDKQWTIVETFSKAKLSDNQTNRIYSMTPKAPKDGDISGLLLIKLEDGSLRLLITEDDVVFGSRKGVEEIHKGLEELVEQEKISFKLKAHLIQFLPS